MSILVLALAFLPPAPAGADGVVERQETTGASFGGEGVRIDIRVDRATDGALLFKYSVRNERANGLLVFDRGDTHAVSTGKQAAGAVGNPVEEWQGGDLTLVQAPRSLGRVMPTTPPVPLAKLVPPGAAYEAVFGYAPPGGVDADPRRLRYCLTVADAPDALDAPYHGDSVFRVLAANGLTKTRLCSPWFDRAAGRFEQPER